MKLITVKDLKKTLRGLPDDAIVCCQSDSEGNETSTCLGIFVEEVGKPMSYTYADGKVYNYVQGDNIIGIDLDKDKGKIVVILQPSL